MSDFNITRKTLRINRRDWRKVTLVRRQRKLTGGRHFAYRTGNKCGRSWRGKVATVSEHELLVGVIVFACQLVT